MALDTKGRGRPRQKDTGTKTQSLKMQVGVLGGGGCGCAVPGSEVQFLLLLTLLPPPPLPAWHGPAHLCEPQFLRLKVRGGGGGGVCRETGRPVASATVILAEIKPRGAWWLMPQDACHGVPPRLPPGPRQGFPQLPEGWVVQGAQQYPSAPASSVGTAPPVISQCRVQRPRAGAARQDRPSAGTPMGS